jgi:hypothetical protein
MLGEEDEGEVEPEVGEAEGEVTGVEVVGALGGGGGEVLGAAVAELPAGGMTRRRV